MTRFDLRFQINQISGDATAYITTLRVDKPFLLNGGKDGILSLRVDLPLIYSDAGQLAWPHEIIVPKARIVIYQPQQREILRLLAEGKTAKEIAAHLHLTSKTIEYHKYQIMLKLDVRTSAQLIQYAVKHGISSV